MWPDSDTGPDPRNNRFPESVIDSLNQPDWINDLDFGSGDDDDDDKSNFTDTELVDNPLTIAPTTSRNNAFLDEWESQSVSSCSPPPRRWVGESPQCLYR
jgi:hypothetical protein